MEIQAIQLMAGVAAGQRRAERGDRGVTERYFAVEGGRLLTRVPVMPSMLTCDPVVIRQDCLCYLMERYDHHLADAG